MLNQQQWMVGGWLFEETYRIAQQWLLADFAETLREVLSK